MCDHFRPKFAVSSVAHPTCGGPLYVVPKHCMLSVVSKFASLYQGTKSKCGIYRMRKWQKFVETNLFRFRTLLGTKCGNRRRSYSSVPPVAKGAIRPGFRSRPSFPSRTRRTKIRRAMSNLDGQDRRAELRRPIECGFSTAKRTRLGLFSFCPMLDC